MKKTQTKKIEYGREMGAPLARKWLSLRASLKVAPSFKFFADFEHLSGNQAKKKKRTRQDSY